MAVFHSPETPYAQELRKWEYGEKSQGYRGPRVFEEFPKAMFKADQTEDGIRIRPLPETATDRADQARLERLGWHEHQEDAIAAVEAQNREIAKLAAERHYHERHMSEPARREVARAEAETDAHLPVIVPTPIKKRGRPRKVEPLAG